MSIVFGFVSRAFLIAWPPYCVFDEVYFGNFTNFYMQRRHFIDVHPPFAKLLFALVGYVCGYNGTIDFEGSIRDEYKDRFYVNFRFVSASILCHYSISWVYDNACEWIFARIINPCFQSFVE
jgi:dolichyl-phosphate-mannose-protein mannosyltransferase